MCYVVKLGTCTHQNEVGIQVNDATALSVLFSATLPTLISLKRTISLLVKKYGITSEVWIGQV